MFVTAIVPSAGVGSRLKKGGLNKPYLCLRGKPILAHTLRVLESCPQVSEIIVVVNKRFLARCRQDIVKKFRLKKVSRVVAGGATRSRSVYNGLAAVSKKADLVLVHDGARPFLTKDLVKRVINKAKRHGAAIAAVPVIATVKEATSRLNIKTTPDRSKLWMAQTPQVFKRDLIVKAYGKAFDGKAAATDDAALVEKIGHTVKLIKGSYKNIKITTDVDLELAKLLVR